MNAPPPLPLPPRRDENTAATANDQKKRPSLTSVNSLGLLPPPPPQHGCLLAITRPFRTWLDTSKAYG